MSYFDQFKRQAQRSSNSLYTKEQKQATEKIFNYLLQQNLSRAFTHFSINTQTYKNIKNKELKVQGSLQLLNYQFSKQQVKYYFNKMKQRLCKIQGLQGYRGPIQQVGDLKMVIELKNFQDQNQSQTDLSRKMQMIGQATKSYLNKQIEMDQQSWQMQQQNAIYNVIQKDNQYQVYIFERLGQCDDKVKQQRRRNQSQSEQIFEQCSWNYEDNTKQKIDINENEQIVQKPKTLSQFLKKIQYTAPYQLKASQVLPILILQNNSRYQQEDYCDEKFAFFYQFKDNYIYNFDYSDTFIDELVQKGYILEVTAKSSDEDDYQIHEQSAHQNSQFKQYKNNYYKNIKRKKLSFSLKENELEEDSHRDQAADKVKSITNEEFEYIVYYPIINKSNQVIAIIEVCYDEEINQFGEKPKIKTKEIKKFISKFKENLSQHKQSVELFCLKLDHLIQKKDQIKLQKAFKQFNANYIAENLRINHENEKQRMGEQTEQYFGEYINNLESYDQELRKLVDEREGMMDKIKDLKLEKKAKLKFLASALFFCTSLERKIDSNKMKNALNQWKQNIYLTKIAESAFSKVLEVNHSHSFVRMRAASTMLKQIMKRNGKKQERMGFGLILKFVKFNSLKQQAIVQNQIYQNHYNSNSAYSNNSGITEQQHTQLFGNLRGSYNNIPSLSNLNQSQMNNSITLNQSTLMRHSVDGGLSQMAGGHHGQSQSVYGLYNQQQLQQNQFLNQHSLSLAASDSGQYQKASTCNTSTKMKKPSKSKQTNSKQQL